MDDFVSTAIKRGLAASRNSVPIFAAQAQVNPSTIYRTLAGHRPSSVTVTRIIEAAERLTIPDQPTIEPIRSFRLPMTVKINEPGPRLEPEKPALRTCSKCGKPKEATTDNFYRNGSTRGGFFAACKVCCARRDHARHLKRVAEEKASHEAWLRREEEATRTQEAAFLATIPASPTEIISQPKTLSERLFELALEAEALENRLAASLVAESAR